MREAVQHDLVAVHDAVAKDPRVVRLVGQPDAAPGAGDDEQRHRYAERVRVRAPASRLVRGGRGDVVHAHHDPGARRRCRFLTHAVPLSFPTEICSATT
jgi:hypothetical protein